MEDEIKEFAKELCALLHKHRMGALTGNFVTGFNHNPSYKSYQFVWKTGRHGEDACSIDVHYEEQHKITIPWSYNKPESKEQDNLLPKEQK